MNDLKENHRTVVMVVALVTMLNTGLQAAGFTLESKPEARIAVLEAERARGEIAFNFLKARTDTMIVMVEALLIDRCLDKRLTPSDLSRMRINCSALLNR